MKCPALIPLTLLAFLAVATPASAQVGAPLGRLDPNLATEEQLKGVKGLTPEARKAILAQRPILKPTQLDALVGTTLPAEQKAELYRALFVPVNLNAATPEEILLIPGVGKRMLHEFEEYRPWSSLAHFRREIGKYVDDKELGRLESYVFVPVNLNTGSDADILSIPGVGKRMLHEFKEYRPWKSMAHFRKEIGKYVDAKELTRLEHYVTL